MKYFLMALGFLCALEVSARVIFDQVRVSGTGCPEGSVNVVPSPDLESVTLLFDNFRLEVPDRDGAAHRRPRPGQAGSQVAVTNKVCLIGLTSTLDENQEAYALEVSLHARGSTILDPGLQASFLTTVETFTGLAQSRAPTTVYKRDWITRRTAIEEEWTQSPVVQIPLGVKCARGNTKHIRWTIKNHISATTLLNDLSRQGVIAVDSADLSQGLIKLRLKTRRCGDRSAPVRI
jgi:Domain of unknown function (DUF4360)